MCLCPIGVARLLNAGAREPVQDLLKLKLDKAHGLLNSDLASFAMREFGDEATHTHLSSSSRSSPIHHRSISLKIVGNSIYRSESRRGDDLPKS